MDYLPDILDYNLKVVFIGYNPGLNSARIGHHYAGKSNNFWKLLYEAGFTPYKFTPEEDGKLIQFGLGSTNIVDRPTRGIDELKTAEFREGAIHLKDLLEKYRPGYSCYMGIGVYRVFSGKKEVVCGIQKESVVEGVKDYVCSSPSGLNRTPYSEQLICLRGLNELLN